MHSIIPYKIISYILLLFAAFFALASVAMFAFAFSNPQLFFSIFLIAIVITYIISSFIFLIKGINQNKKCSPKLQLTIKRTAYTTLFFAALTLIQSITALYNQSTIAEAINQMIDVQKNTNKTLLTSDMMIKIVRISLYITAFFATTLLIHVYETFKFLKQKAYLFTEE
jgi:hypothetical protein